MFPNLSNSFGTRTNSRICRATRPGEIDQACVLMTGHQFSFEKSDRRPDKKGRVRRVIITMVISF